MIRAVFDTNILVSATFWDGNESKLIENIESGKIELYISPEILNEFERVISQQKFNLISSEVESALEHITKISHIVIPAEKLNVILEDPTDNKILECAVGSNADYIVSGDGHLLNLKEFRGIKILKSRELLDILEGKTFL